MMVPRLSGERALRVLEDSVPWANVTVLPRVSSTFAFGVRASGRLDIVAHDEANDRHHAFEIADLEAAPPERAALSAELCVHAPFN